MNVTMARQNLIATVQRTMSALGELGYWVKAGYQPEERKEFWKAFDRTARKYEPKFKKGAAEAFEHDRREILAIVNGGKKKSLEQKATVDWAEIKNSIADYLATGGQDNWRNVFAPLVSGLVTEQGKTWAARLGVQFNVQNLGAREWFNNYTLTFAQPINDTTEREIAQIMERAQADGSSVPQIQNQLDALFDRYITGSTPEDPEWQWFTDRTPPYRTEMIARTETIRSSNAGTNGLFTEWGVKRQEWLSTKDDRTRSVDKGDEFDHLEADGQIVKIDEKFTVSGEELSYPGDPAGSPGNTINCRCTILPVIEEGEELQPVEPEESEGEEEKPTIDEAEALVEKASNGDIFKDVYDELYDYVPRDVYAEYVAKDRADEYTNVKLLPKDLWAETDKFEAARILEHALNISEIDPKLAPSVLLYNGEYYLLDGHHRILSRILLGEDEVITRVYDMGNGKKP